MNGTPEKSPPSIWWFAFGYFAAYAPYSALTKALSKGLIDGQDPVSGLTMLPATVMVSLVGMLVFLTGMGWWKHATQYVVGPLRLPGPRVVTLLSGLLTAVIIGTTTMAYTFSGVSIVFMMLLMRGGVLVIAPIVDMLTGRRTAWNQYAALALSLAALVAAFSESGGYTLSLIASIDVAAYLAAYFFRLRFMSQKAKSTDPDANLRYFVEEQMVASPAILLGLGLAALAGVEELRDGFTTFLHSSGLGYAMGIGLLSQLTGIFGGLVLLDKRAHTFCVPVNRSSSILAGVVAAFMLTLIFGQSPPSVHQLVGAGLVVTAILFLSVPGLLKGRHPPPTPGVPQ